MWRIAVCDTIWLDTKQLSEIIEQWGRTNFLNLQLEQFRSGEEVLGDIADNGDFTAIFLDVELPGINGVRTAKIIRDRNRYATIVFVSQLQKYYRQILELSNSYYLDKPIMQDKVYGVLEQMLEDNHGLYECLTFRFDRRTHMIRLQEVLYFVSEKRIIRIYMENGKEYVYYEKLDNLDEELSEYLTSFLRIHKSYLVNTKQIKQFQGEQLLIANGDLLPISREKRSEINRYQSKLV